MEITPSQAQPPARSELRAGILEEKTEFPERHRLPVCPRLRDQGVLGSSPVKAETLGRFRFKECGEPYLGSVSNSLALLLVKLPRCQNPEIKDVEP